MKNSINIIVSSCLSQKCFTAKTLYESGNTIIVSKAPCRHLMYLDISTSYRVLHNFSKAVFLTWLQTMLYLSRHHCTCVTHLIADHVISLSSSLYMRHSSDCRSCYISLVITVHASYICCSCPRSSSSSSPCSSACSCLFVKVMVGIHNSFPRWFDWAQSTY